MTDRQQPARRPSGASLPATQPTPARRAHDSDLSRAHAKIRAVNQCEAQSRRGREGKGLGDMPPCVSP